MDQTLQITLNDGSLATHDVGVSAYKVAKSISSSLAKKAVAAQIDGNLVDLSTKIEKDCNLSIVTRDDDDALEVLRHSSAHLLAQAVKDLYPEAQITIGPVVVDGFYYDIALEKRLVLDDLAAIEERMQEITRTNLNVTREEITREQAIKLFHDMGEHYKVEIIKDLPEDELLTIYRQGDFVDLCRGPHVPNLSHLQAFKLTKLAGAYWRADANNAVLQRIYGTAWANKKQLKQYLHRIEEAKKRDHRKLATQMDLFHFQEQAPGQVFWHPNGWQINQTIRQYLRDVLRTGGYQEINTPQLVDEELWQLSGHMEKFDDDMFTTSSENRQYVVKPMNCPCHIQVFKQGLKSYRDLPLRFSEYGCCHRNEPSGTLHGLMRLRGFVQDDGHIFCTLEQISAEVTAFIEQLQQVYKAFGFDDLIIKLSTRPEKRVGTDEQWDQTEAILAKTLDETGLIWSYSPGEGAFYGPKIEFALKDSLGRVWQCGTIQLDPCMPERLGATYVAEDGSRATPFMLHRAMLGSLERFIGVLLEEYGGELPLWLAPVQLVMMSITDKHAPFCLDLAKKLQKYGFRVKTDLRNEKIGFKIREHTLAKVPCQLVIGDKELESSIFAIRLKSGKQLPSMSTDTMIDYLKTHVDMKSRTLAVELQDNERRELDN